MLWLSNETPDRFGQGGQRRQFFQIVQLARAGIDVAVLTLAGPQSDDSVRAVARVYRSSEHLWHGIPSPAHRLLLRRVAATHWHRVVVAHTESWVTWQPLLRRLDQSVVLVDMHNVLSAWHRRERRPAEADRWARIESAILSGPALVSVCSAKEAELLGALDSVIVLPHGVEPAEWTSPRTRPGRPVIKLFGNWGWAPNARGLAWFLAEVWPSLQDHWVCELAGSGVTASLPDGVRTTGRVASISHFLSDASAVAVPVLDGVGAPVKYMEALASGAPVVSTWDGAPALPSLPVCVSDDPEKWVEILTDIRERPALYESLAQAARSQVLHVMTWEAVCEPLTSWAHGSGNDNRGHVE